MRLGKEIPKRLRSCCLPLVYEELRRLATARMANEAPGQTLQPTALVHEAWLRISGPHERNWNGRQHFFAGAAEATRRILVDRARRRQAAKRGAGAERLELDELDLPSPARTASCWWWMKPWPGWRLWTPPKRNWLSCVTLWVSPSKRRLKFWASPFQPPRSGGLMPGRGCGWKSRAPVRVNGRDGEGRGRRDEASCYCATALVLWAGGCPRYVPTPAIRG